MEPLPTDQKSKFFFLQRKSKFVKVISKCIDYPAIILKKNGICIYYKVRPIEEESKT